MDIIDKINEFKFRYLIINTGTNYHSLKRNFKELPKPGYRDESCIFDWDEGEVLLFSKESMRKKTFPIKESDDLSFLDKYRTDDMSFFHQVDKVSPNMGTDGVESIYALDNIWLAYTYHTKSNLLRMCINSNLFGTFQTLKSREFNIEKLLT